MKFSIENIILIGSILMFISLVASRTTKYGVPALLLFLLIGMAAGSDGIGGIHFNDVTFTKFIGAVALSIILFSGGLDTKYSEIKPVLKQGIFLSTLGVLLTCAVMGLLVSLLTEFTLVEGFLLGAIVSSTDAAAVFSILRSKSVRLKGTLKPLLELESGSNDPMAYFLTIVFTFLISNKDASYVSLIPMFFRQMILGALVGYLMGLAMHKIINWIKLEYEGLYPVLLITLVFFVYSFTEFIGGNPFLAIYLSACILGNKEFIHKRSLTKHFDGQAWLMQIVMFLTLGLLVFPKQIIPLISTGLLITAVLIFIARPVSVFLSLIPFKAGYKEKFFISWVGLRGAVPIILATYPLTAGIEKATAIFNLVFFISVVSVLIQGTSLTIVAKWLNLSIPDHPVKKQLPDMEQSWNLKSLYNTILIEHDFSCINKSIVDLRLPSNIIIALVERGNKYLLADGSTTLIEGDKLYVMADEEKDIEELNKRLGKKQ